MADSADYALLRPEFLRSIDLGEQKIIELMRGKACEYKVRESLIGACTEHQYVYRLVSGWVCRARELADGRSQIILIFLPGDLFAVKSMLVTRHSDAVMALNDVVVERIHYRELHALYTSDSDVASRCTWQVMEEERRLHNWVVGLGQGGAHERMAALTLDLRARLTTSGTIAPDALCFDMPLTQGQLGDYLGMTAVHVNRVLRDMREQGMLTMRDGRITIDSAEALAKCASPLLDAYERGNPSYVGLRDRVSASIERQ